jgi:hypothetical protein
VREAPESLPRDTFSSYVPRVRREPLLWLVAFVPFAGASACAMVAGLGSYTNGDDLETLDASKPVKDGASTHPTEGSTTGDDGSESSETDGADDVTGDGAEIGSGDGGVSDADAGEGSDASDGGTVAHPDASIGDGGDGGDGGHVVDAGDGGSGNDGGCHLYVHNDGTGQVYSDCAPLNTYNSDEAMAACQALDMGACAANTAICGAGPTVICTQSASTCRCWSYSGGTQGHVNTSLAGVLCACPTTMDPVWF